MYTCLGTVAACVFLAFPGRGKLLDESLERTVATAFERRVVSESGAAYSLLRTSVRITRECDAGTVSECLQ